jgi:hypothetical protein
VRPGGELALLGHGRVRRPSWAGPDLRDELAPFVVSGISILAPLVGDDGLAGVLLAGERPDGRDVSTLELDVLALLCDAAAVGLANARRCHTLADGLMDALVACAGEPDMDPGTRVEAAALADQAARMLLIPPRLRDLLARGVELGEWAGGADGRQALDRAAAADPTGRLGELTQLVEASHDTGDRSGAGAHQRQAAALLRVARDYRAARRRGEDAARALAAAIAAAGEALDDAVRITLLGAATASSAR